MRLHPQHGIARTLYLWCSANRSQHTAQPETTAPTTNPSTNNPPTQQPTPPQQPQQHTQQPHQPDEEEAATPNMDERCGDVGVHGFWCRGRSCIFDVRMTDTSCRSNRNTDPLVVLQRQAKEKKDKYRDACLELRMDFCPLVYSVEGVPGTRERR
ncbi:hypothetical protein ACHAXR_008826 [Thalassiosira sp. AJA248-18]